MIDRSDSSYAPTFTEQIMITESEAIVESFENLSPEVQINTSSNPVSDQTSNTSSQADTRERQQLTFEDDLWDQLPEI